MGVGILEAGHQQIAAEIISRKNRASGLPGT
jgi:hypothetical protein